MIEKCLRRVCHVSEKAVHGNSSVCEPWSGGNQLNSLSLSFWGSGPRRGSLKLGWTGRWISAYPDLCWRVGIFEKAIFSPSWCLLLEEVLDQLMNCFPGWQSYMAELIFGSLALFSHAQATFMAINRWILALEFMLWIKGGSAGITGWDDSTPVCHLYPELLSMNTWGSKAKRGGDLF